MSKATMQSLSRASGDGFCDGEVDRRHGFVESPDQACFFFSVTKTSLSNEKTLAKQQLSELHDDLNSCMAVAIHR
eukprot:10937418-Alexandrium_andersonii.AAC.1